MILLAIIKRRLGTSGTTYALLTGLLAVGVIGAVSSLGDNTSSIFGLITNTLSGDDGNDNGGGGGTNTAPSISDIQDASIGLDGVYGPTDFIIGDTETAAGSLSVSAISSDQVVVPDGNITLGGADENRNIQIVPAAGQSGAVTITVTVDDGTDQVSDDFVLTVSDSPACSDSLPAGTSCIVEGQEVVYVTTYDPSDGGGPRLLLAQHCDQGMSWDGLGCTGTREGLTWNSGQGGYNANVLTTVDEDGKANTDILVVLDSHTGEDGVQPFNAAQSCRDLGSDWFLPATDELVILQGFKDSGDLGGTFDVSGEYYWASVYGSSNNADLVRFSTGAISSGSKHVARPVRCLRRDTYPSSANNPPVISAIADDAVEEGESWGPTLFSVVDVETSPSLLSVTATSSNQAIIADGDITLGGTDANRTISIATTNGQIGTVTINVTVDDGEDTATEEFLFSSLNSSVPACSTSVDSGTTCMFDGEEVVLAALYDPGDGGGERMFMIQHCDQGMSWDGTACAGSRTDLPWNDNQSGYNYSLTPSSNVDGKDNTDTLMVNDSHTGQDGTQPFQAASSCRALGASWFLPARDELALIYNIRTFGDLNGTFEENYYWGSSSGSNSNAYVHHMGTDTQSFSSKHSDYAVRCARRDTYPGPANTAPNVSAIDDGAVDEGSVFGPVGFQVTDVETVPGNLIVTATSSNQSIIANGDISLGGSGANRTIQITTTNGQTGAVTITVTADDGTDTGSSQFTFASLDTTVPTCGNSLPDGTTCDLDGMEVVKVANYDPLDGKGERMLLVAHCDQGMSWDGTSCTGSRSAISWNNGNTSGYVAIAETDYDGYYNTQLMNTTDSDSVTSGTQPHLAAAECSGIGAGWFLPAEDEFFEIYDKRNFGDLAGSFNESGTSPDGRYWTSSEVNSSKGGYFHPPSGNIYGQSKATGLTVRCAWRSSPPTISDISNAIIAFNGTYGPTGFTVDDTTTPAASLIVTASSSDQTLVPDANITLGGSGASRTIEISPAPDQDGSATITVTVDDGTDTASDVFVLTVNANVAPTISDIYNSAIVVNGSYGPNGFTVSDVETAAASLVVTASSSDQTLVPDANITLGGSGVNRTIEISPAADQTGSATITVTVDDGTDTTSDTFVLIVNPNVAPTISDIPDATIPYYASYGTTGFTVSDNETAAGSLVVTAVSSNQTLVPDGNITLGGSDGNRTITISNISGQTGTATITVTVDDGELTTQDTFVLTVDAIPTCSGSLPPGTTCMLGVEEVVFVTNYDPLDGGGSRPFYAQHCDQGMSWNNGSCTGTRTTLSWNNGNNSDYVDTSVPNNNYNDGLAATNILVTEDSDDGTGGTQPHQAAESCRSLGSSWFLPGLNELNQLYANQNALDLDGTFDDGSGPEESFYWSSSEDSALSSWSVRFYNGDITGLAKHINFIRMRCIRRD